jgi:enoyl-CoA hydratase/carnithine racemase
MLAELGRLWDELEHDESCRAIVLTGAGTRAFTVGADISGDLSDAGDWAELERPTGLQQPAPLTTPTSQRHGCRARADRAITA